MNIFWFLILALFFGVCFYSSSKILEKRIKQEFKYLFSCENLYDNPKITKKEVLKVLIFLYKRRSETIFRLLFGFLVLINNSLKFLDEIENEFKSLEVNSNKVTEILKAKELNQENVVSIAALKYNNSKLHFDDLYLELEVKKIVFTNSFKMIISTLLDRNMNLSNSDIQAVQEVKSTMEESINIYQKTLYSALADLKVVTKLFEECTTKFEKTSS